MANELDVGSIVLRLRADATGILAGLDQLEASMGKVKADTAQAASSIDQSTERMTASVNAGSVAQAAAYAAMAAAAVKAYMAVVGAIDSGIQASERYKGAMIGLQSVARGTGAGFEPAVRAAGELTDAFFDSASAATSLKNLLSRGYSLEQAVNVIKRLKDAAAFGRQGTLSLAEAVQSATEGLRNENSVLADNAGVTKNVSVMHKEYAASIGTTVDKLTQAQKVEAEYAGIMRETQNQLGDLAKASDTLSGKQAEASQSGVLLARAYGEEMTPAVKLLAEGQKELLDSLTGVIREFPGLAAGLSTSTIALAGFFTLVKGWQAMKAFNAQMIAMGSSATILGVSFQTAFPWLAAISAVIGLAVGAWSNHQRAVEEAARAEEEAAQKRKEHIDGLKDSVSSLNELKGRYEELATKTNRTFSESEELLGIQKTLASQYGINVSSLDSLGEAYQRVVREINEKIAASEKELQSDRELAAQQAMSAMESARAGAKRGRGIVSQIDQYRELAEEYQHYVDMRKQAVDEGNHGAAEHLLGLLQENQRQQEEVLLYLKDNGVSVKSKGKTDLLGIEQAYKNARAAIDAEGPAITAAIRARMSEIEGEMISGGASLSNSATLALRAVFEGLVSANPNDFEGYMDAFASALSNADIGPAIDAMQAINAKILSGAQPTQSDMNAISDSWAEIMTFVSQLVADGTLGFDQMKTVLGQLAPVMSPILMDIKAFGKAPEALFDAWKQANISAIISSDLEEASEAVKKSSDEIDKALSTALKAGQALADSNMVVDALNVLKDSFSGVRKVSQEEMDATISKLKEMGVAIPQNLESAETSLKNYSDIQAAAVLSIGEATDELAAKYILYFSALRQLEAEGQGESAQAQRFKALTAQIDEAKKKMDELGKTGYKYEVTADTKPLQQQLDEAVAKAQELGKALENSGKAYKTAKEINAIAEAAKKGRASTEDLARAQQLCNEIYGRTIGSAEEMADTSSATMRGLESEAGTTRSALQGIIGTIQGIIAKAAANPSMNINTSPAINALRTLAGFLNPILSLFGLGTLSIGGGGNSRGGGGGGGGGGSKKSPLRTEMEALTHDVRMGRVSLEEELRRLLSISSIAGDLQEQREIAEAIHDQREEIRKAALESDYRALDHRKTLGQLTARQEIEALEQIAARHSLTNEERMELDEKLYEARKRLQDEALEWEVALLDHRIAMEQVTAEQEVAILKNILDGYKMDSRMKMELEERLFNKRKELREKNLSDEKESIRNAYNAVVEALKKRYNAEKDAAMERLDAKIAALDEETNAENEARRRQEYDQKLADKQRELSVEKSARRRRELTAEIAKMEADEELRRKQAARQDEKSLLQQQKKALQDKYTQLTDEENLRQEALRMVMSNNLHEMAALIESYGDTWKDAGMQLAESLTAGLISGKDRIVETITRLNNTLHEAMLGQFSSPGATIPNLSATRGVVVQINGLTVREEADIDKIADAIYQRAK